MLQSEFYDRTGVTLTGEEYARVEHLYNDVEMGKDEFCKQWLKLRNNKLFNEVAEGHYQRENELYDKINNLYEQIQTLKKDYDSKVSQKEKELEQARIKAEKRITEFAKTIVRAYSEGDEIRVQEVIEEEFGYPFVIKAKHEAGILLSNEEISYMVDKL